VANLVTGNLVEGHPTYGIVLIPMPDERFWPTGDNEIVGNTVRRSGLADLAIAGPTGGGDCFAGNDARTSTPPALELLFPCDGFSPNPAGGGAIAPWTALGPRLLADVRLPDFRDQPSAPPQPTMPDPGGAPPRPAIPDEAVPGTYDVRPVGAIASAPGPEVAKEPTLMGMPISTSWGSILLGLYGYVLPFVIYAAWVAVAMWDLIRQEGAPIPHRARWMMLVLVVPFLGPLLYFAFGRSPIPRELRLVLTIGAVAVYLVFLGLGVLIS
jgi:hypothetical protein